MFFSLQTLFSRSFARLLTFSLMVFSCHVFADHPHVQGEPPRYTVAIESDDFVTRALFDAISDQFNVDILYKKYDSFEDVLDGVISGDSDFAANVTHTEARSLVLDYSSPTNIEYTYFFSKDVDFNLATRIGVPSDSIYLELLKHYNNQLEIREYHDLEQAQDWLSSGHVQGTVDAINLLRPLLEAGFDAHLLNNEIPIKPVSLVATKDKHRTRLNEFATFIQSELIQRHLRHSVSSFQFKARMRAIQSQILELGIDPRKAIRIKLENAYPFASYDDTESPTGISADTVFAACEILQLNCELVSKSGETWESMYQDLIDKKIDLLAPLTISEPRKQIAFFSTPHFFPQAVMVKRQNYKNDVYSSISELIVERIGVIEDDFFHELLAFLLPNKSFSLYPSQDALIKALLDAEVDYIATDRSTLNHFLLTSSELTIEEDDHIGSFYESSIAMGFVKSARGEALAHLFSDALKIIDTTQINNAYAKPPNWRTNLQKQHVYAQRFQITLAIILTITLASAWYLYHQSRTDNLTQLRNRRALVQRYRAGIRESQSLLYLDLNKFKEINDLYGHDVGDQVLMKYSQLIRQYCSGDGYRIGGDEFIVVSNLNLTQLNSALSQLERFSFKLRGFKTEIILRASIGVYQASKNQLKLADILSLTDLAMYEAKRDHHTDVVFVDDSRIKSLKQNLAFRSAIEAAINNANIDCHFDIVYERKSKQPIAAQCKISWVYQEQQYDYHQLREHADVLGLSTALDELTLAKVTHFCRESSALLAAKPDFQFWMHICQHSISNSEKLLQQIDSYAPLKQHLALLIDERYFSRSRLKAGINKLTLMGLHLVVDDFGAKNASFYALNQEGITRCKTAARVAVQEQQNSQSNALTSFSLIDLLAQLDKQIIVSGIDNQALLDWANQQSVRFVQGQQLSPVLSTQELRLLLG
ncbi:diguanylate cyclase [Alginatibacterium sediminis]|uniref:Diguanylate cyclase n=1 Tax=Alginatibacterium sediminis TaxID=2164068 RepID=A0A420EBQ3_9ALTE|nr:transporter substrate-binding domain-containing protein [Alginatibacterium sediminis]RKF18119.1 diguanylate cyclase [Alginatibacterium sediminis]